MWQTVEHSPRISEQKGGLKTSPIQLPLDAEASLCDPAAVYAVCPTSFQKGEVRPLTGTNKVRKGDPISIEGWGEEELVLPGT